MNRKFAQAQVRQISDDVEKTRYIEFVASDNSRDSYRTVLPVDKWDLNRFNKNGVIGYQHALYYSTNPDTVIGTGRAFVENNQLIVGITFEPVELNPIAEKLFRKVIHGTIKAVSVGFDPIGEGAWGVGEEAYGKASETYYYAGMDLLEVSVVHIPANKNAVKRAVEHLLDEEENDDEIRKAENERQLAANRAKEELVNSIEAVERDVIITEAEGYQSFIDN